MSTRLTVVKSSDGQQAARKRRALEEVEARLAARRNREETVFTVIVPAPAETVACIWCNEQISKESAVVDKDTLHSCASCHAKHGGLL